MSTYILQKDMNDMFGSCKIKAGSEFLEEMLGNQKAYVYNNHIYLHPKNVENNPEWFKLKEEKVDDNAGLIKEQSKQWVSPLSQLTAEEATKMAEENEDFDFNEILFKIKEAAMKGRFFYSSSRIRDFWQKLAGLGYKLNESKDTVGWNKVEPPKMFADFFDTKEWLESKKEGYFEYAGVKFNITNFEQKQNNKVAEGKLIDILNQPTFSILIDNVGISIPREVNVEVAKKINVIANKFKWTDEDMRKCYEQATENATGNYVTGTFEKYIESLNKNNEAE